MSISSLFDPSAPLWRGRPTLQNEADKHDTEEDSNLSKKRRKDGKALKGDDDVDVASRSTKSADVLFGARRALPSSSSSSSKSKRPRSSSSSSSVGRPSLPSSFSSSASHHVELLLYASLYPGQLHVVGIKSILSSSIVVTAANGIQGKVAYGDVPLGEGSSVPSSYHVGDLLLASVKFIKGPSNPSSSAKTRVTFSLLPKDFHVFTPIDRTFVGDVIQVTVKSIEGKGYICEGGDNESGKVAFLPFDEVDHPPSSPRLPLGSPVLCVVTTVNDRSLTLSSLRSNLTKTSLKTSHFTDLNINQLHAGLRTKMQIKGVRSNGIVGTLFDHTFLSCVHYHHLYYRHEKEWAGVYKKLVGKSIEVRILYLNLNTKTVVCSNLPHILKWERLGGVYDKEGSDNLELGQVLNMQIVRWDTKLGVYAIQSSAKTNGDVMEVDSGNAENNVEDNHDGDAHVESKTVQKEKKRSNLKGKEEEKKKEESNGSDGEEVEEDEDPLDTQSREDEEEVDEIGDDDDDEEVEDSKRKKEKKMKDTPSENSPSSSPPPHLLYCSLKHISDRSADVSTLMRKNPIASVKPSRIISFNGLDGLVHVSMEKSVMEAPILKREDMKIGMVMNGLECLAVGDFGVLVKIRGKMQGLIPPAHLADITLSDPQRHFKVGHPIAALRILQINHHRHRVIFTHKKALLKLADEEVISSYDQLQPNHVGVGFISDIQPDKGLVVQFFNLVSGFIHIKDLIRNQYLKSEDGIEIKKAFYVGQIVKCRVTKVSVREKRGESKEGSKKAKKDEKDEEEEEEEVQDGNDVNPKDEDVHPLSKRISVYLSLNLKHSGKSARLSTVSEDRVYGPNDLSPGMIIDGTITKIEHVAPKQPKQRTSQLDSSTSDEWTRLTQTYVFLRVDSHPSIECRLAATHLSDHVNLVSSILQCLQVGDTLSSLLVLAVSSDQQFASLTRKASFLSTASSLPKSIGDVHKGDLFYGFIRSIDEQFGIYVGGLNKLVALVPKSAVQQTIKDVELGGKFTTKSEGANGENGASVHQSSSSSSFAFSSHYVKDQTVRVRILSADASSNRLTASLKPEDTNDTIEREGGFIQSYFEDLNFIVRKNEEKKKTEKGNLSDAVDWSLIFPGAHVNGTVEFVKANLGVFFQSVGKQPSLSGFSPSHHSLNAFDSPHHPTLQSSLVVRGASFPLRVLDCDQMKNIVDVSMRTELIVSGGNAEEKKDGEDGTAQKGKRKAKATRKRKAPEAAPVAPPVPLPSIGTSVSVIIQLVRRSYFVVSLPEYSHSIAFAASGTFNYRSYSTGLFRIGGEYKAVVTQVADSLNGFARTLCVLNFSGVANAVSEKKKAVGGKANLKLFDPNFTNIKDIQAGKVIEVEIAAVRGAYVECKFGDETPFLKGRINFTEIADPSNDENVEGEKKRKGAKAKKGKKSEMKDTAAETPLASQSVVPLQDMAKKIGQRINAKILEVRGKSSRIVVILSSKKSTLESDDPQLSSVSPSSLSVGTSVLSYVKNVDLSTNTVYLTIGRHLHGRLRGFDISEDPTVLLNLEKHFVKGQQLKVTVIDINAAKQLVEASLVAKASSTSSSASPLAKHSVGDKVMGRVTRVVNGVGVYVDLRNGVKGRIHLCDIDDEFEKNALSKFNVGQMVEAVIVGESNTTNSAAVIQQQDDSSDSDNDSDGEDSKKSTHHKTTPSPVPTPSVPPQIIYDLSMRPSRLDSSSSVEVINPEILSVSALSVGAIVSGFVKRTDSNGCFVFLSRNVVGRVKLKNLSDKFIPEPAKKFFVGKLVKGKVLQINGDKVEITTRKTVVNGKGSSPSPFLSLADLHVGDVVKAEVVQLKPFGVFLKVKDSNVSGLCHISRMTSKFVKNVGDHYQIGDRVKAKVVEIDVDRKRIGFSLKDEDVGRTNRNEKDETKTKGDGNDDSDEEDEVDPSTSIEDDIDGNLLSDDDDHHGESESEEEWLKDLKSMSTTNKKNETEVVSKESKRATRKGSKQKPSVIDDIDNAFEKAEELPTDSKGHSRSNLSDEDGDGDSVEDPKNGSKSKLSKSAKAAAKRAHELELLQKEAEMADPDRSPTSSNDFERLIFSSPNSSELYVSYMNHLVSSGNIDGARRVGDRGIQNIHYREVKEKLNVYLALLALEISFGNDDQIQSIISKAMAANDIEFIRSKVAHLFAAAKKNDKAREAFESLVKRHNKTVDNWVAYGRFLFSMGEKDEGRALLSRALKLFKDFDLSSTSVVEVIVKFSKIERDFGEVERGRTLLDNALNNFPKRTDLWNVYADFECKVVKLSAEKKDGPKGKAKVDLRPSRSLLRRIVDVKLKNENQMLKIFKQFSEIEKTYGDNQHQQQIKTMAAQYVKWKLEQKKTSEGEREDDETAMKD